ncbi:hypothetical protein C8Q76DRAFT_792117 [Earliella scabrosa]|nr:hypothetical protein C8Q76DRAFT_792117 [Earliella scabrosa]
MRGLSLFKTASSSSQSSGSRRSSMLSDTSSNSSVSYVQFPGLSPAQRQPSSLSASPHGSGTDYAEMLEDDNLAWGSPKKSKGSRR